MLLSTREPDPIVTLIEEPDPRMGLAQRTFRRQQSPPPAPLPPPRLRESERAIEKGDELRLAVVIQMPLQSQLRDDQVFDDEPIGWEPGMELGIWQGSTVDR